MAKGLDKFEVLQTLKETWDTLHHKAKKDLIYSLLGHRISLVSIASQIGRGLEEVKNAYKGVLDQVDHVEPTTYSNTFPLEGVHPTIATKTPSKAIYNLTFDELLQEYRKFVGWDHYTPPDPGEGPDNPDWFHGLIISDIHAPFHDEKRFAKMINDTKGKVDSCILAGDAGDFNNYSKYMKYGQTFSAKQEHEAVLAVFAMLSESYPEVILIPGNHDERTRKKYAGTLEPFLYQAVLDFHGKNAFDFAELLSKQFKNFIIPESPTDGFAEYRFIYQIYDIVVGHPEVYSSIPNKAVGKFIHWIKSEALPKGLLHEPITAAVMGHTHQAGKTWNDYHIIGIENGCLCMTPDYASGAKLCGASRPLTRGYTMFKTNKLTGRTGRNDIQFVELE